jgi:Fusaric acid resistance protein-like
LRTTIVMPSLFALCLEVIHNPQMATFASFGSFATLLFAAFGGTRLDKLVAHTGLAVTGTVLIVIGTAVSAHVALAAGATVVVAFCVLFAGIAGPNAASGATAALVAYVLPASSPGSMSVVPDRLAGWWLASAVGTVAVLTLAPRPPANRLRASAAVLAQALADQLDTVLAGSWSQEPVDATLSAKRGLQAAFDAAPYRPTGLAVPDQALANLVESLEWCTTLVCEALQEKTDLTRVDNPDEGLFRGAASVLGGTARLLRGAEVPSLMEEVEELARTARAAGVAVLAGESDDSEEAVHISFHARVVAAAAISAATDALIAARQVDPAVVRMELTRWQGIPEASAEPVRRTVLFDSARRLVSDHTSLRSVWFLNSARGAVALAVAVAVADLTNVQHAFWVVLGTLSVLRTNAAGTGATALRAIAGTVLGFFIGGGLILAIGSHPAALWAALPVAVLVASYSPGTLPFAAGQAGFTVTISILFNILVPVGWKVGVVRLEDVAIGAAVSALVGIFFWPRGAASVVGDDLADAYHGGGIYLVQATAWALGLRSALPDAGASTVRTSDRLDVALRALLAEQGSKKVPKEQLWRLVGGARRLRLTAQSLLGPPRPEAPVDQAGHPLVAESVRLAGQCDGLAALLGRAPRTVAQELAALPAGPGLDGLLLNGQGGYVLWVRQHLDHVGRDLANMTEPADAVAERRARPWWR